ncbi:urease accessory protein UreD [Promicromonospora soli]|uniref:Urease accessory protein UreD n=1 Tax=Promicromonospora soli TaxID=2035533 RepID=A0A919FZL1_9MICO|nr:urease accessory protein UreD [Promicromonospora soli]GHH74794.1 hypothetical protein GCM10017772_29460 [Promicromonospora soli]
MAERTTTPTRTDRPMLHAGLPAPSATRVTRVAVERPTGFGAPVRVRTSDGLLAARLVARDGARAEVALVAGGAMLLGGDHVVVSVQVDSGCALTLTDVGGTVAYDGDGQACRWDADIRLGPGAGLAWAGLPFVVAGGADVRRTTTARLGAGAGLTLRETVVLGRSGERGGRVLLRTDIADGVGPILVEELAAAGDRPVPGVLGDHPVIDTLTRVHGSLGGSPDGGHDRPGTASGAGETPGLGDATTLHLERGGVLTRWLGAATHLSPLELTPDRGSAGS